MSSLVLDILDRAASKISLAEFLARLLGEMSPSDEQILPSSEYCCENQSGCVQSSTGSDERLIHPPPRLVAGLTSFRIHCERQDRGMS